MKTLEQFKNEIITNNPNMEEMIAADLVELEFSEDTGYANLGKGLNAENRNIKYEN